MPDILQNGDEFFFPIFSSEEAMGEYGNGFSKVARLIADVIPLARNNERKLRGIILDAFTQPFMIPEELWEAFENADGK